MALFCGWLNVCGVFAYFFWVCFFCFMVWYVFLYVFLVVFGCFCLVGVFLFFGVCFCRGFCFLAFFWGVFVVRAEVLFIVIVLC